MTGCTNCGARSMPQNILCHRCLDTYYRGHAVKGAFGVIQNSDGAPASHVFLPQDQMDLFQPEEVKA